MPASKIRPDYLKRGDEVMIVSPAFCIDRDKLDAAVEYLGKWGLKARVGKNAAKRYGPFAGTDAERLEDLQEATGNPDIKAVICSRGGYGVSRIIDRVDFTSLRNNPKWYVGFSDITVLHLWLSELHGLMSVHGAMPLHFNDPEKTKSTFSTLKQALFGNLEKISWKGDFFRINDTEGEITGGNLSLFYSLIGTAAEPDTKGKILFIEEVGEYFYHVDRMLTSLKLAGKLQGLAALVVGGMNRIESTSIPWGRSVEETIMDIVGEYDYPVLFGFPAGHVNDNRAFYFGRQSAIRIQGNKAVLSFE
ncbi:MAG: S66 peptidase family protein [Chloroflexota bacterium]